MARKTPREFGRLDIESVLMQAITGKSPDTLSIVVAYADDVARTTPGAEATV